MNEQQKLKKPIKINTSKLESRLNQFDNLLIKNNEKLSPNSKKNNVINSKSPQKLAKENKSNIIQECERLLNINENPDTNHKIQHSKSQTLVNPQKMADYFLIKKQQESIALPKTPKHYFDAIQKLNQVKQINQKKLSKETTTNNKLELFQFEQTVMPIFDQFLYKQGHLFRLPIQQIISIYQKNLQLIQFGKSIPQPNNETFSFFEEEIQENSQNDENIDKIQITETKIDNQNMPQNKSAKELLTQPSQRVINQINFVTQMTLTEEQKEEGIERIVNSRRPGQIRSYLDLVAEASMIRKIEPGYDQLRLEQAKLSETTLRYKEIVRQKFLNPDNLAKQSKQNQYYEFVYNLPFECEQSSIRQLKIKMDYIEQEVEIYWRVQSLQNKPNLLQIIMALIIFSITKISDELYLQSFSLRNLNYQRFQDVIEFNSLSFSNKTDSIFSDSQRNLLVSQQFRKSRQEFSVEDKSNVIKNDQQHYQMFPARQPWPITKIRYNSIITDDKNREFGNQYKRYEMEYQITKGFKGQVGTQLISQHTGDDPHSTTQLPSSINEPSSSSKLIKSYKTQVQKQPINNELLLSSHSPIESARQAINEWQLQQLQLQDQPDPKDPSKSGPIQSAMNIIQRVGTSQNFHDRWLIQRGDDIFWFENIQPGSQPTGFMRLKPNRISEAILNGQQCFDVTGLKRKLTIFYDTPGAGLQLRKNLSNFIARRIFTHHLLRFGLCDVTFQNYFILPDQIVEVKLNADMFCLQKARQLYLDENTKKQFEQEERLFDRQRNYFKNEEIKFERDSLKKSSMINKQKTIFLEKNNYSEKKNSPPGLVESVVRVEDYEYYFCNIIFDSLIAHPRLKRIILLNSGFRASAIEDFVEMLENMPLKLKINPNHLDLSGCNLSQRAIQSLTKFLESETTNLRELLLDNVNLTDWGVQQIFISLLRRIKKMNNVISGRQSYVKRHRAEEFIRRVSIENVGMGDYGFSQIVDSFDKLYVEYGKSGTSQIGMELLEEYGFSLNISRNKLGKTSFEGINKIISQTPILKTLLMEKLPDVQSSDLNILIPGLALNYSIETFSWAGNGIDYSTFKLLFDELRNQNYTLKNVMFDLSPSIVDNLFKDFSEKQFLQASQLFSFNTYKL